MIIISAPSPESSFLHFTFDYNLTDSITHHNSVSQVLKLKERLILNTYLLNKFEMQLGSFLTFEIEFISAAYKDVCVFGRYADHCGTTPPACLQ